MKKRMIAPVFLLLLMAALLTITATAAEIVDSGYCGGEGDGTNISWTLDSEGTLVISGIGRMLDYTYSGFSSSTPWYNSRNSITRVVLQNGIAYVGDNSFAGCNRMTSVIIPNSVTSTGYGIFQDCNSLTSIIIPNSITSIAPYMFVQCGQLTSVTIPDSVTSIQGFAFLNCSNLKDVTIPNSVRHIGNDAFGCCGLIKVTIPDGINEISAWTFSDCFSLTSVTIPDSVVSIEDHAFDSTGLRDVYYGGSETQWNAITIGSNNIPLTSATIHYNSGNGTDSAVVNLYPENGKVLNLDDPSKGTSATNYLDAKPRIFFDREVDSYAGRAKLDFSNGTLEIRRSSDDGLVYSVKESAGNPGTSNQMPLWGEASPYTAVRLEDAVSTLDYETEYYIVMPEGFVKFSDGTASLAIKKGDWTFKTVKAPVYRIIPMEEFGELSVNSSGVAIAWFRIEDENESPISGATLQYQLNGATAKTVISDGNGLVSVETPHLEKTQDFHVLFSAYKNNLRGIRDIPVVNGQQDFTVTVKALSYTQEWSGGFKVKAKADAEVVNAGINRGETITVTDDYDDGVRTLELKYENEGGLGLGFETPGAEDVKLNIGGLKRDAKISNLIENGLKIEGYNPSNRQHRLGIGAFTLLAAYDQFESSVFNQSLMGLAIDYIKPEFCTVSRTGKASVSEEASLGDVEIGVVKGSLGNFGSKTTWSFTKSSDYTDQTHEISKSVKTNVDGGLVSGLSIGTKSGDVKYSIGFGDYVYGGTRSNNKEISAKYDDADNLKSISYKTYIDDEKDVLWGSSSIDTYAKVTFKGDNASALLSQYPPLSRFCAGKNPFIDTQATIDAMSASNLSASVKETTKVKTGLDVEFPISVKIKDFLKISLDLSGEGSHSFSNKEGVLYNGSSYVTVKSDVTHEQVDKKMRSLGSLLLETTSAVWEDIWKNNLSSALDSITAGVRNAYATVKSSGVSWYASISAIPNAKLQSVDIATLMSADEAGNNAAISATLGEPYVISVYADEAQEIAVTDTQLAEHPLTLTLEYTDAMLSVAGVSSDADVMLFSFDSNRGLYIYESSCVQDKERKTVTAQITKSGEYILATDNAPPTITDFGMENRTLTPTLTVLISDLSGLGNFRFWIDNDNDLVTMENIKDHYNSSTGVFTYEFASALLEGTHTANFLATDNLGNANASPVSFTFEAHPLRGTISITHFPTSAIINRDAFTVKAKGSGMESFSQVNLRCSTGGNQILSVLPMTWENDAWTVQVTPVDGVESLALTAIAEDSWGNTITSDSVTVTLNLPRQLENLQIRNVVYDQGVAQVTVQAPQGLATSGTLFVGVYQNGRQLCIGSGNIGLASGQFSTVPVVLPNFGTEATTIKAFLLSPDEFIPLCAAYTLQL